MVKMIKGKVAFMRLAKRTGISPSLTMAMNTRAKEMRRKGIDVISFAAGEPDFTTPDHVKDAAKRAINENKTYYTPASGIPELKELIVKKFKEENGLEYSTDEVVINSGAKHSVFNTFAAVVDKGDEVIIPAPYWVSYSEMVNILDGNYKLIKSDDKNGFKITAKQLEDSITEKSKTFLLNSPNNPTGAVYSKSELFELAEVLETKEIYIISDEIYEKILYDGKRHVSIATYSKKIKENTIVVNGLSKAFSMTGWRIGYAAGPKEVISAIGKLQGHTSGNPPSISQWAGVAALKNDSSFIDGWVKEFKKRRDYIVGELNNIPMISCSKPEGAFYVFPSVNETFGKMLKGYEIKDSVDLSNYLLKEGNIATVPGKAFGVDGYIRLSFATSMDNIVEGMKRMKVALTE